VGVFGNPWLHGRYLTSVKLFNLQQADSNFRRQFLVQFLILFQSLTAKNKFRKSPDGSPRDVSSSGAFPFAFVSILFDFVLRFSSCFARVCTQYPPYDTTVSSAAVPHVVCVCPPTATAKSKMKEVDCLGWVLTTCGWGCRTQKEWIDSTRCVLRRPIAA
jgi:hypothetical protein